jgi:co-chaperonin GroES (HSP10)
MVIPRMGYLLVLPVTELKEDGLEIFDTTSPTIEAKIIKSSTDEWDNSEYLHAPEFNEGDTVIFLERSAIKLKENYLLVHVKNILATDGEANT